MNIPTEVWGGIISYLELNDLIEMSCVSKDFYRLSLNNCFHVKKLTESKSIFTDRSWILCTYSHFCDVFYCELFRKLVAYISIDCVVKVREIVQKKLYFAIMPFHIWNSTFLCCRSQYESNMCLFCTKIYLKNKRICKLIEKCLTVNVLDYFPVHFSYGVIISGGSVNLFVHFSVTDR